MKNSYENKKNVEALFKKNKMFKIIPKFDELQVNPFHDQWH